MTRLLKGTLVVAVVGVAAGLALLIGSLAEGQIISYDTGSEVSATCETTGTLLTLYPHRNYAPNVTGELVYFKLLDTADDAGWCASGGTPMAVGPGELLKARKPNAGPRPSSGDAGVWNTSYMACCRSTGGTGVLTLTPVQLTVP